jgi:hypothetical protein
MLRMIYLVLLVIILLTGCMKEAELTVYNDTHLQAKVSIDGLIYDLAPEGEPAKETYYLDSYLLYGDKLEIPVEYIQTTPYRTEKKFTVEMKPGKDKTYHIRFDRGQMVFWNISPVTIYEIKVRDVDDDEWSDNLLQNVIDPDDNSVIPIPYGNYIMKISDPNGFEWLQDEIEIPAGETITYWFWG